MPSRRYTVVFTDLRTGAARELTLSVRLLVALGCAALTLPVMVGIAAGAWSADERASTLNARHQVLELENASYRSATEALTGQIESLQSAIVDLGTQSAIDPNLARAMDRLPALVKARAMGGGSTAGELQRGEELYVKALSALAGPEDTFGLLRTLLERLESRLMAVQGFVERRNALAAATPSLWPVSGWLTSTMGHRKDPMSGADDFHAGLDIAAERGTSVFATAEGMVSEVGYRSAYGNLIVLDHGFGIQTRYGHLSKPLVRPGDPVKRGDVIGLVGATGRATGPHLHYEVTAYGRILNPLRLLTQKPRDR